MPGPEPASPVPKSSLNTLGGGRYVIARKLAEGGTAYVHLGWDTKTKEWRAIKTLLPDYAKRPALRHRFEVEARTMQVLVHPNIVTVFDAGQEGDAAYMVMELAEGGSIIDWVERHGRMPPRLACRVVLDVCAGIAFAHDKGIIHRDIKPQNVLVAADGTCKVTDFGIAQIVQETRMTMTGTVMGTIGYMAPEQHESAKHADIRADIYSVAATLYTLLMGEAPTHLFMADDRDFDGIPTAVAEVIRKGSQYRREMRYESMAAFGEALRAAAETLPPDPEVPPLVRPETLPTADLEPPTAGTSGTSGTSGTVDPVAPALPVKANDAPIVTVPPAPLRPPSKSEHAQPVVRSTPSSSSRLPGLRPVTVFHEARVTNERRRRILGGLVALLALIVLGTSLVVVVGATRIHGFETLRDHADQVLYEQIHEERALIDFLAPLDLPEQAAIRQLFDECESGERADREAAINRLVGTLDTVRRNLETRGSSQDEHAVKQLRESVRRIQARMVEAKQRDRQLDEILDSPSGRVASFFGM